MPRTIYRCVVNLTLNEVSAPGVRLFCREDVYLTASLFGQYHTTRFMAPDFALLVYETFHFEKTFYSALDFYELEDYLNDELIIIELVQLSDYADGAVRLASFSARVRGFLQPFPLRPYSSSSADHQILLARTIAFNGISPKLTFSTRTVVKESLSPELDALADVMEEETERRVFSKTHRVPTNKVRSVQNARPSSSVCVVRYDPKEDDPLPRHRQHTKSSKSRCRSASLRVASGPVDIDLSNSADHRPDFVVRSLSGGMIRHIPENVPKNVNTNASKNDKGKEKEQEKEDSSREKKKKRKSRKSEKEDKKVVHCCEQFHDTCPCGDYCAWCYDRKCRIAKSCCQCVFSDCECCRRCRRCCQQHHAYCGDNRHHPGEMCCPYTKNVYNIHHRQPFHVYISDEEDDVAVAYSRPRASNVVRYPSLGGRYYGSVPPPEISLMVPKPTK